jgi:hypothetical protein
VEDALVKGGKYHGGYIVYFDVNAKNQFGGYTGKQTHGAFFQNGKLVMVYTPDQLSTYKEINMAGDAP